MVGIQSNRRITLNLKSNWYSNGQMEILSKLSGNGDSIIKKKFILQVGVNDRQKKKNERKNQIPGGAQFAAGIDSVQVLF